MKGVTAEGKIFTGISLEKFKEILAGKPGICHSEGVGGRYHIFNCPGSWAISSGMLDRDQCRDMNGETRSLSERWNIFTYYHFPEWFLFSTWAEYDHAQEKKKMSKLESENRELSEKLQEIRSILGEIDRINNAGGPRSRRAVRELIDSCR